MVAGNVRPGLGSLPLMVFTRWRRPPSSYQSSWSIEMVFRDVIITAPYTTRVIFLALKGVAVSAPRKNRTPLQNIPLTFFTYLMVRG